LPKGWSPLYRDCELHFNVAADFVKDKIDTAVRSVVDKEPI
jgi:hypothetical protein